MTNSVLPIVIAPNPILKSKAKPVLAKDSDVVRDLIPQMFATMYHARGIGLAAPQIGMSSRVAIVDLRPNGEASPFVMVNPEIVWRSSDTLVHPEGCLSIPGQRADIERPSAIKVRFEDVHGMKTELDASGLLGICIQHEIDHLDGILFVDHLSPLKRGMILRKMAKELKTASR